VHTAKASYRTPNQVVKADIERNENLAKLQTAYAWAVSKKDDYKNKVELADKASETFNVQIVPQTLRNLIREGRSQIMQSGPKCKKPKEDLDALSSALNTWLAIGQINGDPERKTEDMLRAIDEVIKNKKNCKKLDYIPALQEGECSLTSAFQGIGAGVQTHNVDDPCKPK
jgi:hypothetical protein